MKFINLILGILEFVAVPFSVCGAIVCTGEKRIWMIVSIPYFLIIGILDIRNYIKAKHRSKQMHSKQL